MDFNKIKEAAQNYEADMTKFLREIVKFPGESCGEKDHIERIAEEMRKPFGITIWLTFFWSALPFLLPFLADMHSFRLLQANFHLIL